MSTVSVPHGKRYEGPPRTAIAAALLLFVEAAGMAAVAAFIAFASGSESVRELTGGIVLALIAVGAALFLLQAGRALLRAKAWSRSAAVVWQVLQIGVGFGTFDGGEGEVPLALLLVGLGVATMALVLRRSVSEWLRRPTR